MGFYDYARGSKNFVKGVFSEPDGTPSSTRLLMFIFSAFSLWLIYRIFKHVFGLSDTTTLTIWLSNVPLILTALMGLIALPYTINRGAGAITETFSGIANMMASAKQVQMNATLEGKLTDIVKKVQGGMGDGNAPAPPAAPAAPQATGTDGTKG